MHSAREKSEPAESDRDPVERGLLPASAVDQGDDGAAPRLVQAALRDCSALPGLVDVSAWLSRSSRRGERRWMGDSSVEAADRAAIVDAAERGAGPGPFEVAAHSVWALVRWVGERDAEHDRSLGCVVALFAREEDAGRGATEIELVAGRLQRGLGRLRQAADGALAAELSRALARAGSHADWLREWAARLAAHTRSDGIAIHLWRRTIGGPRIQVLHRTDRPDGAPAWYPMSGAHGLPDWVVRSGDWLLVDQRRAGDRAPAARSGRGGAGAVRLRPWRGQEGDGQTGDRGRHHLVVPVRVLGASVGALSLWRAAGDPYSADVDRESAERFAEQLAAACRWLVESEMGRLIDEEVGRLGRSAAAAREPVTIYRAVAAGAGRIAGAARTVLLLHEAARPGLFYEVARWSAAAAGQEPAGPLRVDGGAGGDFCARIEAAAAAAARAAGGRLIVRSIVSLPAVARDGPPPGAVVLLDAVLAEHEAPPTADEAHVEHAVACFCAQVTPSLLENYPHALAQRVGQRLAEREPADAQAGDSPEVLLQRAASSIREATCADAVIVYMRGPSGFTRCGASPAVPDLQSLSLEREPLIERCIRQRGPTVVLDVADRSDRAAARLDTDALRDAARAYRWDGVRSWLLHPVMRGDRCLGAIKLLTRQGGAYLDPCSREVVEALAARTAGEMWRLACARRLRELNDLTRELSGTEDRDLPGQLADGLERLARRFVQPGCRAAVISTIGAGRSELYAASPEIDQAQFKRDNRDLLDGRDPRVQRRLVLRGELAEQHQLAVPIGLNARPDFGGSLVLVGPHPFSDDDRLFAEEAAREIALLLYHQHRRREWAMEISRFRHFIIGPVQGLDAVARMLRDLVEELGGDPDTLRRLEAQRHYEAEQVRMWRENERIYRLEEVEVQPRPQALRRLVEHCVERYRRGLLEHRGITLKLHWGPPGSLEFPFDKEAIDLVLTNLIDNASKYCFYNREIEVGISLTAGKTVEIWVEDIGFEIPERLRHSIYRVGGRLDWKDRLRSIDGTGLGLPMARALVQAHDGTLRHTSVPAGAPREDHPEEVPHRVRFTVELPTRWRQR
jgi:signal transduction histidine kinase